MAERELKLNVTIDYSNENFEEVKIEIEKLKASLEDLENNLKSFQEKLSTMKFTPKLES